MDTASGTWAVAVMGGSAASHNNFWQLFVRAAGTSKWRLVTPPGVASNGGLVLASPGDGPVVAGFRPSQNLSYSPLATTGDNGTAWTPGAPGRRAGRRPRRPRRRPGQRPPAGAAHKRQGRHLRPPRHRLDHTGQPALTQPAPQPGPGASQGSLTAAAFSPSGVPLLAASCAHPGTAGIFAYAGGTWHPAGPTLPGTYAHQAVTVLRLTTTGSSTTALLAAGGGPAARLLTAASADSGAHWTLSPALPLGGARLTSASFGTAGTTAIILTGNRADTLTAAAGPWRPLPPLPPGTVTLAQGPTAGWDALAVHGTRLTVWQLTPGARAWATTQTINVPIQYRVIRLTPTPGQYAGRAQLHPAPAPHRRQQPRTGGHTVNRNREARQASSAIARAVRLSTASTSTGRPAMTTKTYPVTGMSCSHCVQAVTTELNRLGGQVTIDLVPGGTSQVIVTRHTPLPDAAIRQALSEAGGYQLTTA